MKATTTFLLAAGFAAVLALPARAFPDKPIQVVVPAGPGSATDTVVRLVLNKIEEQKTLGQPAVVINVTAGGVVAATRVKDAKPDGHELMVYHAGMLGTRAVGRLAFGQEAFEAIAQTGSSRFILVSASSGPYKDVASLIAAAKDKPGTITEANAIGGASHIASLVAAQRMGYKARIVNVGDGPKRLQSVLGGHSAYTLVSPAEYKGFEGAGIQPLAVLAPARSADLPQTPSSKELGFDVDFSVDTWWFAPKNTPKAVVDQIASAIEKAMADPALKQALLKQGVDPTFLKGKAVDDRIAAVDADIRPLGDALQGK